MSENALRRWPDASPGEPAARTISARDLAARLWFPMLIAAAIAFRLFHFTHLPDDQHEWRQAQTLMYAASYHHGAPWPMPQGDWFGATPKPAGLEFPITSIAISLLSPIAGLIIGGRILSFGLSLLAILLFDRICLTLGHPRRRTATVLFALSPVLVFYGHAIQPEPMLLALLLAAVYAALRAETNGWPSFAWVAVSAITLAGASMIKPTALLIAVPVLLARGWTTRRWVPITVILAVATSSTIGWGAYIRGVLTAASPDWYAANIRPEWLWGPLSLRWSPAFYSVLLTRGLTVMLPTLSIVFVVLAAIHRRGGLFWWSWLLGGFAGILLFAQLNLVHFYYQLLLIPALAALAALGVPQWPRPSVVRAVVVAGVLAATIYGGAGFYLENPIYYQAGTALAKASAPADPVLVLSRVGQDPSFPTVLFYAGRRGWNLALSAGADRIDRLPGAAPCVMVIVLDGPAPAVPAGWRELSRTPQYVLARRDSCGG